MIGFVSPTLRAIIHLRVRGEVEEELELVVDTGFTGFLALTHDEITRLQLPFMIETPATLADGNDIVTKLFAARVEFDGEWRDVEVLEANGGALIGMALLENCSLQIEVRDGGRVLVEAL